MLIVAGSISDADEIEEHIRKMVSGVKMRTLKIGKVEEISELKNALTVGEIVVATLLASRGFHLDIVETVRKNGGLHVIVTFPPINCRVDAQVKGRAARMGQPGSGNTILQFADLKRVLGENISLNIDSSTFKYEDFVKTRAKMVNNRLKAFKEKHFDAEMSRAKFFDKMCVEMNGFREMCAHRLKKLNASNSEESTIIEKYAFDHALLQCQETWALWMNKY